MTRLEWDVVADRTYFAGVDRGVIYPVAGGPGVAWNGLTAVTETTQEEVKKGYLDGRAVMVRVVPAEYSGKIEAITYPAVMDALTGAFPHSPGIRVHNSIHGEFHMTYRTRIGNPVDGTDYGYRLHLLYNLNIVPDDIEAKTLDDRVDPTAFSWSVTSREAYSKDNLPLTHLSIDSREVDPTTLSDIENLLYGTSGTDPTMPDPTTLIP